MASPTLEVLLKGCLTSFSSFASFRNSVKSDKTAADETDEDDPGNPQYVFIIVLNQAGEQVLTVHTPEDKENYVACGWYLPRFQYDPAKNYESSYCIRDLYRLLDPDRQRFSFTIAAELFPKQTDVTGELDNSDGIRRVTLVNMQPKSASEYELPSCAQWSQISDVLETAYRFAPHYDHAGTAINAFLRSYVALEGARLEDRRCTSRWTYRAVDFLLASIRQLNLEPVSDIERVAWRSLSELFRVKTHMGWYYLKAPPPGSAEIMLTQRLSELFPGDLPPLVGVSESLGCFVIKGVSTMSPTTLTFSPISHDCRKFRLPSFVLPSLDGVLGRKIARIQLQSVQHLEEMKSLGVPEYSPNILAKSIDTWMSDPVVQGNLEERQYTADEVASVMRATCARLSKSKLPLTLIHGDYRIFNVGIRDDIRKDDRFVIFDWESACITHPFAETCVRGSLAQCTEYRKKWQKFATRKEVEVEMVLARGLGWMTHIAEAARLRTLGPGFNRRRMEFAQGSAVSQFIEFMRSLDPEVLRLHVEG